MNRPSKREGTGQRQDTPAQREQRELAWLLRAALGYRASLARVLGPESVIQLKNRALLLAHHDAISLIAEDLRQKLQEIAK